MTLADRTWMCPGCSVALDRDRNAAINLVSLAVRQVLPEPAGVVPVNAYGEDGKTNRYIVGGLVEVGTELQSRLRFE